MMSEPRISVVTVAYNAEATIRRTVESVLSQSYSNIDYLVVDGGSTDGTLDILESYRSRLRYFSEPDYGIYDAMNKGVARAVGSWIHLLNADDWYVDSNALARAVPHLDETRTTYFDMLRVFPDGRTLLQGRSVKRWMLYISAFLPHPALIVSRKQYEEIGIFDTTLRIAADHDLILRLTRRYPINHVPSLLTCMMQGGVSGRNLDLSASEFSQVVSRHGLPQPVLLMLAAIRQVWWGARKRFG